MVANGLLLQRTVAMNHLLGGGVLGDSLGALGHGVLGQLTGEEQTDGGLDLPRGNGGPLVVVSQTAGLGGDALEDVVHERVHDRHGLGGDASVGVDLLQDLVDVDAVGFLPPALLLLITLGDRLLGLSGLLGGLSGGLGRHVEGFNDKMHRPTDRYLCCNSARTELARTHGGTGRFL